MSATRDETVRLAFAKYLLSLATRHVSQPEPLASVSLLLLHDAVEHLLILCCYRVGADPRKSDFVGYWKLIEASASSIILPEKGRMAVFNDARVSLKHRGVQPARAQLQEFHNLVLGFFESVVPKVFGSTFASINLSAFMANESARKSLEAATAALDQGLFTDAVTAAAYAFDDIRQSSPLHRYFGTLRMPDAPHIYRDVYNTDDQAHRYFEAVNETIESIHESVFLLSLGIDLARFARFELSAPRIDVFASGDRRHSYRSGRQTLPHSRENAEFCIGFVIDCAFRIQEHPQLHS